MGTRKVYLPEWIAWFGKVAAAAMWLLVTYLVFFGSGEPEVFGWVVSTVVLGVLVVVLHLMGKRKLPVYVLEDEEP